MEKRIYSVKNIEVREIGDGESEIEGYAATYDNYSQDLGGFVEVIDRGFFDKALETSDVVSLWNHNDDKPLGRTSAGTLVIVCDYNGLKTVTSPPDTTWGVDAVKSIRRGDVKNMSFSFTVNDDGDKWERRADGVTVRTLLPNGCKRLYDISPVTFPAYEDTYVEVSSRSLEKARELNNTQAGDNTSQPKDGSKTQARHANRQRQLELLKRK